MMFTETLGVIKRFGGSIRGRKENSHVGTDRGLSELVTGVYLTLTRLHFLMNVCTETAGLGNPVSSYALLSSFPAP
jgi:hypothetical protein